MMLRRFEAQDRRTEAQSETKSNGDQPQSAKTMTTANKATMSDYYKKEADKLKDALLAILAYNEGQAELRPIREIAVNALKIRTSDGEEALTDMDKIMEDLADQRED